MVDPRVGFAGFFAGLRGGYVLAIAEEIALGGLVGTRASVLQENDAHPSDAGKNASLIYLWLVFQLAVHFQP